MYVFTKEVITSMENILVALKIMQQEIQALHKSIACLQNN
jgi:hypothetical protein